jgi:putative transcription factor
MAECEICGNDEQAFVVSIEGAKLRVCRDCARRGKILAPVETLAQRRVPGRPGAAAGRGVPAGLAEVEFVPDYADRIRRARERMKIGVDVLAELVREKESFLRRIESGSAVPNEDLAKRLQRELGIKLFEEVAYGGNVVLPKDKGGKGGMTLGDLIIVKKKGKKP